MKIITAQYQRNGISGRGFYAGIVQDCFPDCPGVQFLVISLDDEVSDKASPTETFVIEMNDIEGRMLTQGWRGDHVPAAVLSAIRRKVEDDRTAAYQESIRTPS